MRLIWGQFHKSYISHQPLKLAWKFHSKLPGDNELIPELKELVMVMALKSYLITSNLVTTHKLVWRDTTGVGFHVYKTGFLTLHPE